MNNIYVQFDKQTGIFTGTVQCSELQAIEQVRTSDIGLLKVASNPLSTGIRDGVPFAELQWDIIRIAVAEDIDAQAEKVCLSFVTPGTTQAVRYQRKEAEARAWLLDNQSPIPMIQAEADALGKTVSDLVNEIITMADKWTQIMAHVEAKRLSAKKSLETLVNIGEMVTVSQINWLENISE